MTSAPWYRRFPDNFIAGTVGLTLEEKGAYSLVLDLIYVRGGPVPDEPRYIAGVCNCSVRKWNAIRQRLIDLGKIEAVDGVLLNRRAEKELEISSKSAQERAESGAKGGNKTAEKQAETSKVKDLGQAELEHTRASLLQYQERKKVDALARKEEPPSAERVDRIAQPKLFAACETLTGEVPEWLQCETLPADIVERARANLAASELRCVTKGPQIDFDKTLARQLRSRGASWNAIARR